MNAQSPSNIKQAIQYGLLGGGISLYVCLVGMVTTFGDLYIIAGVITMGQIFFLAPFIIFSYIFLQKSKGQTTARLIGGSLLSGLFAGLVLAIFIFVGQFIDIRQMFVKVSPDLYKIITFGVSSIPGVPAIIVALPPLVYGPFLGLIAAGIYFLPGRIRRSVIWATLMVVLLGLLKTEIGVTPAWQGLDEALGSLAKSIPALQGVAKVHLLEWLYGESGLSIIGTIVVALITGGLAFWNAGRPKRKEATSAGQNPKVRLAFSIGVIIFLMLIPPLLGLRWTDPINKVGYYIVMGLGLNIVVGYAGLLDLGYVAFFAIGAYTVGVLTSPELGFFHLTYWQAVPIALFMAVLAGVILGLPVLRLRGDYLAIVTLGFGEIVRLLVLSDWLKAFLGGTQGIQRIALPQIGLVIQRLGIKIPSTGPIVLNNQYQLYYIILLWIAITMFVVWRMKDSRQGRAWMALREDEDVAEAMGINLVSTKLLAFASGALFSGLAGTFFAAKLQSAYPTEFNFLVSINVLSVIIVGGMGSIPGVLVGSFALVGLPEILREFAEFRLLIYGAVLVAMMLLKPEGLWPEARRKMELHEKETLEEEVVAEQMTWTETGQEGG
jgi:branched-chain amino acid transport system permease protein